MGFPTAICEKPRCWVALSCTGHSVSTVLGEISALVRSASEVSYEKKINLAFLRGKDREVRVSSVLELFLH